MHARGIIHQVIMSGGGTLFTGGDYSLRHQDLEAQPHSDPRVELGEECMVIEDDDAKSHHRNESRKVWPRETRFRMCGLLGGVISRSQTLPARVWLPIT